MNFPSPSSPSGLGPLRLRNLFVCDGQRAILSDLDWSLPARGLVHLLGPSGAGKSLLAGILARRMLPDALSLWGTISYGNLDARVCPPAELLEPTSPEGGSILGYLLRAAPPEHFLAITTSTEQERYRLGSAWVQQELARNGLPERNLSGDLAQLSPEEWTALRLLRAILKRPPLLLVDHALEEDALWSGGSLQLLRQASERFLVVLIGTPRSLVERLGGEVALLAATNPPAPTPYGGPPARALRWLWPGRLAGMSRPGQIRELEEDLAELIRFRVSVVVILEEQPVNQEALAHAGIKPVHFPIVDMQAPTPEATTALCEELWERMDQDEIIAVHCKGGLGRTGTILGAILVHRGHTASQAVELLRQHCREYVQTEEQFDFLHQFEGIVRRNDARYG